MLILKARMVGAVTKCEGSGGYSVLAGLLVHVGVNLLNLHHFWELTKQNEILKPRCQS